MKTEHLTADLCDTFGVSRSGYYDWRKRQHEPGPRAREDEVLRARISAVHKGRLKPTAARAFRKNSAPKASTTAVTGSHATCVSSA